MAMWQNRAYKEMDIEFDYIVISFVLVRMSLERMSL